MAKTCKRDGCSRGTYGEFCLLHKPRKPIKQRGKHHFKWIEVRWDWIQKHPEPYSCYLCGKRLTVETLTLDHVKPRSGNPELRYEFSNLRPCCSKCNLEKGSKRL